MSAPTAPRRPVVRRVDQTPIAVALVIALALQASPAQAVPASVAKANAGCQKRFAIGVRKIAATTLKSMARCHAERLRGDVGAGVDCNALAELDAGVIAKIDKLAAKLDGTAEKNCVGKGASLPVTLGYATCPAPCDAIATDDHAGVAECLVCVAADAAAAASATSLDTPPAPNGDVSVRACADALVSAGDKAFGARVKEQTKCQSRKIAGKGDPGVDCKNDDPAGKIAKADGKAVSSVARCADDAAVAALDSCAATVAGAQGCVPAGVAAATANLFDALFPDPPVVADPADLVLRGGVVHTVDDSNPTAEAVAIRDGEIVYVGSDLGVDAFCDGTTETIDLRGRLVLPGLHDIHMHPIEAGSEVGGTCQLPPETDPEFLVNLIANCAPFQIGTNWVLGFGHSIGPMLSTSRDPVEILDDAVPDRPAAMMEETSHSVWVNSMALAELGITAATPNPAGGIIGKNSTTGEPNGLLFENAGELAFEAAFAPTPALEQLNYEGLLWSLGEIAKNGITSFADARVYRTRDYHELYGRAESEGTLTARVVMGLWAYPHFDDVAQIADLAALFDDDPTGLVRATQIKIYSDGIIHNTTAALVAPYDMDLGIAGPTGMNYFDAARLADYVSQLELEGFDFHIHAIGDRGVREALDAVDAATVANGMAIDRRHRITHVELVHADDVARFASLGVIADFQVAGDFTLPEFQADAEPLIGARAFGTVPVRTVYDTGATVTLSSDWDVSALNPFVGIENALSRGDESLPDVAAAVRAYTLDAAFALRHEDRTGSLEVGKQADLIVVNQDVFSVPTDKIDKTKVLLTLVGGAEVYRAAGF